ncbi:DinB family protein [uncultured Cyclobacterium sp.]|uniref:DinB family protein n=1 Tax=uncultured Cyclobacterium sp. TaxID=453820 RepID=UPI0030EC2A52|tara:strand:- start:41727 stop:42281 length:555 start_codon:yes stop_codon:yes gene_type:complete
METTKGLIIPNTGDYPLFYKRYVELASGKALKALSDNQETFIKKLYGSLSTDQGILSYSEGKWSFNELLGHIIDTEKLMHFRALSISRGEKSNLPGFDQEVYVANADFNNQTPEKLLSTFLMHRELLWHFIEAIPVIQCGNIGTVSSNPMSLSALIYIIFGHMEHHLGIIKKNYLPVIGLTDPL